MTKEEIAKAVAFQMSMMHILSKCIQHTSLFINEHSAILPNTQKDAFKQLKAKANFFAKTIESEYDSNPILRKALSGAFNTSDELSLVVLDEIEFLFKHGRKKNESAEDL